MKEAKNLSKQATGDTGDMTMAFKDKKLKKKANSDDEYYNCHKLEYLEQDYFLPNKRLNRITQQFRKEEL